MERADRSLLLSAAGPVHAVRDGNHVPSARSRRDGWRRV